MQKSEQDLLADRIDDLLPQTQCGKCGFQGCRPYAEAIASGRADINQCPPGGGAGIERLAALLGVEPKPLNEAFGREKPREVAFILEEQCIGCAKCLPACPVDAILGAPKFMHTVIAAECTGCELCIAPCPVDCIVMKPASEDKAEAGDRSRARLARRRYEAKKARTEKLRRENLERLQRKKKALTARKKPVPADK
ncbi:MAG: electron transport complex subunit RsxB [Gammaproteobacteria bacterium]